MIRFLKWLLHIKPKESEGVKQSCANCRFNNKEKDNCEVYHIYYGVCHDGELWEGVDAELS